MKDPDALMAGDRTVSAGMDLVAGDGEEILLVLSADDLAAFGDRARFPAHLALGAGIDPTWLDLFSEAARGVTRQAGPVDFLDARLEVRDALSSRRTVERIDVAWVAAVAALPAHQFDAIAGSWLDLLQDEGL